MKINIINAHASKLVEALQSGYKFKWACHGSSFDAMRKVNVLLF
jgi:hypothetical protein